MRIGLLGGSFNPAHAAHRHISLTAMKRLHLDAIWWLVSPGNPLKDTSILAPMDQRINQSRAIARHPRIHITSVEQNLRTRFTFDTVQALKKHCRGVRFVWIMGADNMSGFHHWHRWNELAHALPIVVVDRPGATFSPLSSRFGQRFCHARQAESAASALPGMAAPAWVFLSAPRSSLSSTFIRSSL
jgi:nicotinate-nucleotide adenylyltransferase